MLRGFTEMLFLCCSFASLFAAFVFRGEPSRCFLSLTLLGAFVFLLGFTEIRSVFGLFDAVTGFCLFVFSIIRWFNSGGGKGGWRRFKRWVKKFKPVRRAAPVYGAA